MAKSQRTKRRHHEMTTTTTVVNYVSHVQPLVQEGGDSIDDILAEMAEEQGVSLSTVIPSSISPSASSILSISDEVTSIQSTKIDTANETTIRDEDNCNSTGTAATEVPAKLYSTTIPTRPYTKQQLERIRVWNTTMNTWQRTGKFRTNTTASATTTTTSETHQLLFVPSFDIEMTRHFKIQSVSTFLLQSCHGLKMPAFERWLIDSKIEEGTHNYSTFTKFDPVLSGNVTVQYQSTQRLIDEICEASNKTNGTKTIPPASSTATTSTSKVSKAAKTSSGSNVGPMKRNDAKKIVQDLCHRTNIAVQEISQQHLQLVQQQQQNSNSHSNTTTQQLPIKRGDRIVLEGHPPVYTLVYHRDKKWKKPYCIKINAIHYNKLRTMFVRVHCHCSTTNANDNLQWTDGSSQTTMTTHVFHYLVMVLLLRYSSLSGGQLLLDLRGGGMQGAIHDSVFDTLTNTLFDQDKMIMECFGSPLNAYIISGYYSAFAIDIDWHFGSHGSFFTELIDEGCCEVNPPFAPGIMSAMADRIEYNIQKANERESIVTFIVIVPHGGSEHDAYRAVAKRCGDVALQQMMNSENCAYHFILPAKEHGYIEGAQHLRPTRYKESLYDTSIVVLQSTMAREQRTIDPTTFETEIRQAFVSRHREEVESRNKER